MSIRVVGLVLVLVLAGRSAAAAQTQDFTDWLYKRIAALSSNGVAAANKQVETPSVASNSSALVDRSGAPDLIGLATQFFNRGQSGDQKPTSLTLSAFALRSAIVGEDPLRPEHYAAGQKWRKYSFTVGREAATVTGQPDAQLVGVKALVFDRRDPTLAANVALLQQMATNTASGQTFAQGVAAVQNLIAQRLAPRLGISDPFKIVEDLLGKEKHAETLATLTPAELAEVDAVIKEKLVPLMAQSRAQQAQLVQRLVRAPQLALSYQAKLTEDVSNEHQWLAVFDYGLANRISISVNGGMAIVDRPDLDDEASGRLAVEAQFRLTGDTSTLVGLLRTKSPLVISISGASKWNPDALDIHKFQAKLTLPLPGPLNGLSLPISVTVANRTELIDEREVRGQVGFTIDFSKLTSALRLPR